VICAPGLPDVVRARHRTGDREHRDPAIDSPYFVVVVVVRARRAGRRTERSLPESSTVSMRITVALALCGILALTIPVDAGPRNLRMRVSVSSRPTDLYVYMSVERDAENRTLIVKAESDDYFGQSIIQLDGQNSARVATFHFRHVPSGLYNVEANLIDSEGRTKEVVRSALVVG
jgi:hypothetical protein